MEVEEKSKSHNFDDKSDSSKSTMIDIVELETKFLEKKHQIEKLEFYEKNNTMLLDKLAAKEADFEEFETRMK